jgi:hypothetical protein
MIGDKMLKTFARKLVDTMREVARGYDSRSHPVDQSVGETLRVMAAIIEKVADVEKVSASAT